VHNVLTRLIQHAKAGELVRRNVPRGHVKCCGNQIPEKL